LTKAGAASVGAGTNDPDIGQVVSVTVRDGKWLADGGATGTFKVVRDRIVMAWPDQGLTFTFTFKRRADGTLDLEAVLPMDPGDRFQWASAPWRRVGPPVRDIP
jgi:hypothetical protein